MKETGIREQGNGDQPVAISWMASQMAKFVRDVRDIVVFLLLMCGLMLPIVGDVISGFIYKNESKDRLRARAAG